MKRGEGETRMRVPVKFFIAAILALTCMFAGCTHQNGSSTKSTAHQPPASRVVLYRWGLKTGLVEVDLRTGSLKAMGMLPHDSTTSVDEDKGAAVLKAQLSAEDVRLLRASIDSANLFGFSPKYSSFKDALADSDTAELTPGYVADWETSTLSIHWTGSVPPTVLKIPPTPLRSRLPKDLQRKYAGTVDVANMLDHLVVKYRVGGQVHIITKKEADEMHNALDWASEHGLPSW